MKKKEVFKDVIGFEGVYQVSNLGNIKSLKFGKEKILKGRIHSNGYRAINLCKNSKTYTKKVHQLVAMSFFNHEPNGMSLVVDHVNNIKTDNRVENLQIITSRQNSSKDRKNKTSKYTGVWWHKPLNKWLSQIRINGKSKHLGYFDDEYEASKAYQTELKNLRVEKQF